MRDPISDVARLKHILDAILEIEKHIKGLSFNDFRNDSILRYGSVKLLEIIREAVNHLSVGLNDRHPEIEWKDVVRFRNILVHEYFAIDDKTVWETIQNDFPVLRPKIANILQQIQ